MKNLIQRLIGGVFILFILILFTFLRARYFATFVLVISVIALYELIKAFHSRSIYAPLTISMLSLIGIFICIFNQQWELVSLVLIFHLMILLLYMMVFKKTNLDEVFISLFSVIYAALGFGFLTRLVVTPYIWVVYIAAWGSDTFAYICGSLFGKHPLCPEISPNKTMEGAIGGIIGSTILNLIYAYFVHLEVNTFLLIIIFAASSVVAQLGDIAASTVKRKVGIKDYGFIIAGHGGVMDRFDSILFAAPFIYAIYRLLMLG